VTIRRAVLGSLVLAIPLIAAGDAPPKRIAKPAQATAQYAQVSLDAYGEGYAFIERATRLEHDAQEIGSRDQTTAVLLSQAKLAYEDALAAFERAVRADPRMYEAHTYIGYANRKLGRYDAALSAYATALQLKPDYARAIEYQGEAFLGLNRFTDAKLNYLRLYALDHEQAQKLLAAMHEWFGEIHEGEGVESAELRAEAAAWLATQPKPNALASNPQTPW
jgi:tetratricopeptide (TPR) repeat protein